MDLTTGQLLRMSFDAAVVDDGDLPAGLEARLLGRAGADGTSARHPAWATADPHTISSLDAFITTASALADLLDDLGRDDWSRPTRIEGATVRDVVEHLVGVERYFLGQFGRRAPVDAPLAVDHWPATRLAAADLADDPPAAVARTWWREVLGLISASAERGPDLELAFHELKSSVRGLLVVRTFELWTHGDDIRHAIGKPLDALDESRLALMVSELMTVLPMGLALSGCSQPGRTARLHVTGSGGGTFDVPLGLGDAVGALDIVVTVDAIDLCRLAANRLAPDALAVAVEGDRGLLEPMLIGAAAFASD